MVIDYSDVTNGPAEIIKDYIDVDYLENKRQVELHSGVDIRCNKVYSLSYGVVKLIGNNSTRHSIFISADDTNGYNYCHMKNVAVNYYDSVDVGTYLGEADDYLHFEYLNKQESRWPFRIGTETWYKHHPKYVLETGQYAVASHPVTGAGVSEFEYTNYDTGLFEFESTQEFDIK